MTSNNLILNTHTLDLSFLRELQQPPAPFTPGEPLFWDDPHISAQMLAFHLDENIEAASRGPKTIDRAVAWLAATLELQPGDAVIDLGCGPGLYASRLAGRGLRVTGVDYSRRSIAYATDYAREHRLDTTYRYQNYLELADENQYDAALLIYGDFCPLSPGQRALLLQNVRRALKPEGRFVLDVSTRAHRNHYGWKGNPHYDFPGLEGAGTATFAEFRLAVKDCPDWRFLERGFWKPGPHLLLEAGFDYPAQSIWLDQAVVIEENDKISVYRNWFQDYTPETITAELQAGGFAFESLWGDLTGTIYTDDSEWIGLVTRKM
jgi:SAM-dependent methyltransferase